MSNQEKDTCYPRADWTDEEKGYRRGFSHGVSAARRGDVTIRQAVEWENSNLCTCPPGTGMAGQELPGLTKAVE
jgi:hypothetical protein